MKIKTLRQEKLNSDIKNFHLLMRQYKIPQYPIWITEMGWKAHFVKSCYTKQITEAALKVFFANIRSVKFLFDFFKFYRIFKIIN